ncbi:hypothetical protein [Pseudomonas citronellolis]|uniref:hypothetical protein n=1 Tax=Pseudomonas citronellolis TaxID=53408 RepID=UPI002FD99A51
MAQEFIISGEEAQARSLLFKMGVQYFVHRAVRPPAPDILAGQNRQKRVAFI